MMQHRCKSGFKVRKLNDAVEEDNTIQIKSNIKHDSTLAYEPEGVLVPNKTKPTTEGETQTISAKSKLNNLCGARHWKTPVYECCHGEGPCHMRLFTIKTTIEIKEDCRITVLECFGEPQHKKKLGAEQAAEAALWYLKNMGYTLQTEKAFGNRGQTKPLPKMMVTGEHV